MEILTSSSMWMSLKPLEAEPWCRECWLLAGLREAEPALDMMHCSSQRNTRVRRNINDVPRSPKAQTKHTTSSGSRQEDLPNRLYRGGEEEYTSQENLPPGSMVPRTANNDYVRRHVGGRVASCRLNLDFRILPRTDGGRACRLPLVTPPGGVRRATSRRRSGTSSSTGSKVSGGREGLSSLAGPLVSVGACDPTGAGAPTRISLRVLGLNLVSLDTPGMM
ncbi:hypothetical protein EYF80_036696 [Liparis tanakae]|uniref:Uncharacterized protein n=1 Tax=Liparis tanakae TaxID=230148 RepID=A0A4Z2GJZ4_9TELE|nr:hypothetical protein EYF80_036696 [Liparis tanakae]